MTDPEITRLCAEAMGFLIVGETTPPSGGVWAMQEGGGKQYHPLHDDAQAMALVKKFELSLWRATWKKDKPWRAEKLNERGIAHYAESTEGYNRAICECVAKIWNA